MSCGRCSIGFVSCSIVKTRCIESTLPRVRNALERHYGDICYFAQKLDATIAAEAPISLELRNDRMWGALKQHQPRLSLWKYLKYWDELQKQLVELRKIIKDRLQISVGADTRLEHLSSSQFEAALSGIVAAVAFNMEQQARGAKGLNLDEDLNVKPKTGDLVKIEYGSFHLGDQPKNEVGNIKSTIADWRRRVTHWKKYPDMRILLDKLLKTRDKIRDELAVIILRRIVTGHCKYCPL